MQKKTCFFIGHREAPDSILPTLIDEVERHITEYGVNSFVVGHYGQFDALAGQAVIETKKAPSRSITFYAAALSELWPSNCPTGRI